MEAVHRKPPSSGLASEVWGGFKEQALGASGSREPSAIETRMGCGLMLGLFGLLMILAVFVFPAVGIPGIVVCLLIHAYMNR